MPLTRNLLTENGLIIVWFRPRTQTVPSQQFPWVITSFLFLQCNILYYSYVTEDMDHLSMETYLSIRALSRYVECMLLLAKDPPTTNHVNKTRKVIFLSFHSSL